LSGIIGVGNFFSSSNGKKSLSTSVDSFDLAGPSLRCWVRVPSGCSVLWPE
jgi:hypothetical protein